MNGIINLIKPKGISSFKCLTLDFSLICRKSGIIKLSKKIEALKCTKVGEWWAKYRIRQNLTLSQEIKRRVMNTWLFSCIYPPKYARGNSTLL